MAQYTVEISDQILNRVIDGVAYQNGYLDEVDDPQNPGTLMPNPMSKIKFCKKANEKWIRDCFEAHEANIGAETGRASALADSRSISNQVTVS